MLDWLFTSFSDDPPGWISLIIPAAGILSAVFWRRLWIALKAFGRGIRFTIGALSRLRITTVDNIRNNDEILVPVRWIIRPDKDGAAKGRYVLANVSEGSTASKVILHSLSDDAQLLDRAAWEGIPGGKAGSFMMQTREGAFYFGVSFRVDWSDERGKRTSTLVTERWG